MDTATVKPVATKEESGDVDLSKCETKKRQSWGDPLLKKKLQKIRPTGTSKSLKGRMVTQSTRYSSHSSPYGSSLLDRQGDLRTRT